MKDYTQRIARCMGFLKYYLNINKKKEQFKFGSFIYRSQIPDGNPMMNTIRKYLFRGKRPRQRYMV